MVLTLYVIPYPPIESLLLEMINVFLSQQLIQLIQSLNSDPFTEILFRFRPKNPLIDIYHLLICCRLVYLLHLNTFIKKVVLRKIVVFLLIPNWFNQFMFYISRKFQIQNMSRFLQVLIYLFVFVDFSLDEIEMWLFIPFVES